MGTGNEYEFSHRPYHDNRTVGSIVPCPKLCSRSAASAGLSDLGGPTGSAAPLPHKLHYVAIPPVGSALPIELSWFRAEGQAAVFMQHMCFILIDIYDAVAESTLIQITALERKSWFVVTGDDSDTDEEGS
jgi:hypothetical protein